MNMNNQRARWANTAVAAFVNEVMPNAGEGVDTEIKDLLTNLAHLCDVHGLNAKTLFAHSLRGYEWEKTNDGPPADSSALGDDGEPAPPEPPIVLPAGHKAFKVVQLRDAYVRYEATIIAASADAALEMADDNECEWQEMGASEYDARNLYVYDADDEREECALAQVER